jgi:hypothetical protein
LFESEFTQQQQAKPEYKTAAHLISLPPAAPKNKLKDKFKKAPAHLISLPSAVRSTRPSTTGDLRASA